jgi:nicotinate-nucleotide--dimethylbenzimidazole phosphoribosyltransferase
VTRQPAEFLEDLPDADLSAIAAVERRAAEVLRPMGALARLDAVAAWLAGWQRTTRPRVGSSAAVIFVGSHGVSEEGVSAYPSSVTGAMLGALRAGVATAAVMARVLDAQLLIVDVGASRPTGNLAREPALSPARFRECFDTGRHAVAGLSTDLLVLGEMGIGNTTAAAAICTALFGGPADDWTGRGTGIDDEALAHKRAIVEAGRGRLPAASGPFDILRELGGSELVALAGATIEARRRSIPVLLDGFVVTAAVAPLEAARVGALDHCLAAHVSSEPGHRRLLDRLGKAPLLDLGLRLGEGSGALAAVPLVSLAAACVSEVATFAEWGIDR